MSKELYEEALADVRKVTEVAEDNAKRAILDAVTPRIRALIEQQLLSEDHGYEDEEDVLLDAPLPAMAHPEDTNVADAISLPDEEGKVTLDIDSLSCEDPDPLADPTDEYEVSLESLASLMPVLSATKIGSQKDLTLGVFQMGEAVSKMKSDKTRKLVDNKKISRMISRVENMYDYVQESLSDSAKKSSYEKKLESFYRVLTKLQEQTMSNMKRKTIREEDESTEDLDLELGAGDEEATDLDTEVEADGELTLKLTGLPDDVDLDGVGVDLISGDDDLGDESLDDLGSDDDMDLGGDDDDSGEEEELPMESRRRLSDDTVVEIDENMLRKEIARMRRLSEGDAPPPPAPSGVDAGVLDDFGGGSDEGEPLEQDVDSRGASEVLDEMDELDELDDAMPAEATIESVTRRLSFEKRLQERARNRAAKLKKEAARARRGSRKSTLKKEYNRTAKRFNESLARTKKFSRQLVEAKKSSGKGLRSNSGSTQRADKAVKELRQKLSEKNLYNAKLVYANKVLQSDSLSRADKVRVVRKLDEARTPREAKLVYESLVRTPSGRKSALSENKSRVLGSSSRATRPASTSTNLNEGFEIGRWSHLAGITK